RRSRRTTPSRPVKSSAGRAARRRDYVVSETSGATVYQFRVDFTAEVVVEATSIWDALALADEFGPWEITSITRLGGQALARLLVNHNVRRRVQRQHVGDIEQRRIVVVEQLDPGELDRLVADQRGVLAQLGGGTPEAVHVDDHLDKRIGGYVTVVGDHGFQKAVHDEHLRRQILLVCHASEQVDGRVDDGRVQGAYGAARRRLVRLHGELWIERQMHVRPPQPRKQVAHLFDHISATG